MCLDMLLQILRSLECLLTEFTLVWLEWNVDPNMRGNMISLDCSGPAGPPSARQTQIVSTFASDMNIAQVVI
jgi:hypothetical protein